VNDKKSVQHQDMWASGDAYERYMGRWSRLVAHEFLAWLAVPPGSYWLDIGCGTGTLSQTILQLAAPARVKGIDRSEGFVAYAQQHVLDERAQFDVGDAQSLTLETASFDAAVSGLAFNFIPKPAQAASEMVRVVKLGGIVAAYVWDYADKMQFMRHFWDAVAALQPQAADLDEGRRFPLCQPVPFKELFQRAGLQNVQVRAIDVTTDFKDFDDYWSPFLGGQGPAPAYAMSLDEKKRAVLREHIRAGLPFASDGSILLVARAWAVWGVCQ
jgi:SAM-dependent methyltransferase